MYIYICIYIYIYIYTCMCIHGFEFRSEIHSFLFLRKLHSANPWNCNFCEPSPIRWEKDGISISGCQQNVFYSLFSQIWTVFEPIQGPCMMNVWNIPLHDMVCVVKRENPLEWRWKLCEFQHGKSISVSGINLIGWKSCARANSFVGTPKSHTHYHALHHTATYYHTQHIRLYK